jgi:hypothetical protein
VVLVFIVEHQRCSNKVDLIEYLFTSAYEWEKEKDLVQPGLTGKKHHAPPSTLEKRVENPSGRGFYSSKQGFRRALGIVLP